MEANENTNNQTGNLYNSEHYHDIVRGCVVIKKRQSGNYWGSGGINSRYIDGRRCMTHKINLCRCGWEWNWHFGTDSLDTTIFNFNENEVTCPKWRLVDSIEDEGLTNRDTRK